jgi:hypothetical protein
MHASTSVPDVEYGGSRGKPQAGAAWHRASSICLHASTPIASVPHATLEAKAVTAGPSQAESLRASRLAAPILPLLLCFEDRDQFAATLDACLARFPQWFSPRDWALGFAP